MTRIKIKTVAVAAFAAFALSSCFNSAGASTWSNSSTGSCRTYATVTADTDQGNQWKIVSATGTWSGSTNVPSWWQSDRGSVNIGGNTAGSGWQGGNITVEERYTGARSTFYAGTTC